VPPPTPAMLTFCPTCANMLLVDHSRYGGGLKLYCQTCPYQYHITNTIRSEGVLTPKDVDTPETHNPHAH